MTDAERVRRAANREQILAYRRQWHAKNRDRVNARKRALRPKYATIELAYRKAYYSKNKTRLRAYARKYHHAHKEQRSKSFKRWAASNPEYQKSRKLKYLPKINANARAKYAAHPEIFRSRNIASGRRTRASLSDGYVRRTIYEHMGISSRAIPLPLVEVKRALLKLKRTLKSYEA